MASLQPQIGIPERPSFFSTMMSGIGGYVKGAISGGLVGSFGGAFVGAVIGSIALISTGGGVAAVLAPMGLGAIIGGSALASIGAVAGTMTGIVKSREAAQPSADDIVNVAKLSFAQGLTVNPNLNKSLSQHRDKVTSDRAKMAMSEQQIVN